MQTITTERGFKALEHPAYLPPCTQQRVVSESSAIGGHYDDAMEHPGSSFLWLGRDHHLDRAEVQQLIGILEHWVNLGRLPENTP